MKFYKSTYLYFLLPFLIFSCGKDDEPANGSVQINITSFEPSYNEVKITWDLKRFNNAVVADLFVFRYSNDDDANIRQEIIANLPSNETSFTDKDVPYLKDVNYIVKANYFIEGLDNNTEYFNVESEEKMFERDIVKISRIPSHIIRDDTNKNAYHIMVRSAKITLFKYNMDNNTIEETREYFNGHLFYDKINISEQNIYLGTKNGLMYILDAIDYSEKSTFSIPIDDELKSFSLKENEIHYSDNTKWKYFNIQNNESGKVNNDHTTNFVYSLDLENDKMFLVRKNYSNFFGSLFDITEYNNLELLHATDFDTNFSSPLDRGILHFKENKTEFISTIFGRVISLNDLSLKAELKDITGKEYLYFNYDNNGKIYGAVQDEKLIHVFDDETYEHINTIETKLYPIFPLLTTNGELQSLGRYHRVSYWSYNDGFGLYGSHPNCAIEIFN